MRVPKLFTSEKKMFTSVNVIIQKFIIINLSVQSCNGALPASLIMDLNAASTSGADLRFKGLVQTKRLKPSIIKRIKV